MPKLIDIKEYFNLYSNSIKYISLSKYYKLNTNIKA
jgi:hypothetical protein